VFFLRYHKHEKQQAGARYLAIRAENFQRQRTRWRMAQSDANCSPQEKFPDSREKSAILASLERAKLGKRGLIKREFPPIP